MGAVRDLDIVLYGATGAVGSLTARYLAGRAPGVRVGLAGRSRERLEALRRSLGEPAGQWPLLVADVGAGSLQPVAARTRVLLSAVGPYGPHGMGAVEACAATGTDYLDLAAEVPFVRRSIDTCHEQAAATGARIVHSCGFDSIPSDLTVYALHRRVAADGAGELADTTCVLRNAVYASGFSPGTVDTMIELMRTGSGDAHTRRLLDDPYSLSPDRADEPDLGLQPDVSLHRGEEVAPELEGLWLSGYLMALYNTRCVRRSAALMGGAYGPRFRYRETASMGSSPVAPVMALMTNATISGAARLGGPYLQLFPPGTLRALTARPRTGHADSSRGHYRVETYTTTSGGARYLARMSQAGDPGYAATAVLFGESALALLLDRDRLPPRAGVLTPASAMGDALLARLSAAGVPVEVVRLR
ncbi:saccharopine dehydrogenase family protein [Mycolicibacterium vaccae]|uniref:Saccharopine dehydrogenase n=1 Tax=Mycolicibacterium vaccae ATCC 25954 TaxID=1194972 RepID=K0U9Z8_MYCVA|nr:saccharopine dehydrogenase NADP-binding domain-containing protein [Mycolicibacterium vaccae]ANI41187.1 enoyl reductase [Mycolicibacterium vaccae 95051]EJZ04207.1 saccharopine dehydrogenase [Mycolicibacterium vaccae ATCC 25954]MCV7063585.1 saccharopine dehydrogenase NADP-binding domain-containing protein [Mycolicibacterium vaccae]